VRFEHLDEEKELNDGHVRFIHAVAGLETRKNMCSSCPHRIGIRNNNSLISQIHRCHNNVEMVCKGSRDEKSA
jgi:hypothetical protein